MAVVQNSVAPSSKGTGPAININHIKEYNKFVSPGYSGGSIPGTPSRFALQFVLTNGEKSDPVYQEWTFESEADLDAEIVLLVAAVTQVLV